MSDEKPCGYQASLYHGWSNHPNELMLGCQFEVLGKQECVKFDGVHYCEFHLPLLSRNNTPSPKAAWDASKIDKFNSKIFDLIDKNGGENEIVDLTGVTFPRTTNFEDRDKDINFEIYNSPDRPLSGVCFSETTFHHNVSFENVVFDPRSIISFAKARFLGGVLFNHAKFNGADFQEAYFRSASFWDTTFPGGAEFRGARFKTHTQFNKTHFNYAGFSNVVFMDLVDFEDAIFDDLAVFENAVFLQEAKFDKGYFVKGVSFLDASFNSQTSFRERVFGGPADFSSSTNNPEPINRFFDFPNEYGPILPNTVFKIDFTDSRFEGRADFNNRVFLNETTFRRATFLVAPKFHDAVLHQDTDFAEAKFLDVTSENADRSYRTLKLAMERLRARHEEAMFFTKEQKCIRNRPDMNRLVSLVSVIYEWSADYGQSFARPLLRIMQALVAFWVLYFTFIGSVSIPTGPPVNIAAEILFFSVEQIFRPFEIWRQSYDFTPALPGVELKYWWLFILKLFATTQSLITLGFFALFLLALRKRFRMN